ncbi:MAG: hypothetical protein JNK57_03210 [Planctomycetaceae bacterium]|nr:hypothetical protein [Planctomycetaceae bacterium]
MGHSEMLLAVAGLDSSEIQKRTQMLATGDFSWMPPAEGLAHQWAYRLTKEADQLTTSDFQGLQEVFGEPRAFDLIWYISWCNYMTRVADAFQLPLEEENVFEEPPAPKMEVDSTK